MISEPPVPLAAGPLFASFARDTIACAGGTPLALPAEFATNARHDTLFTAEFARLPSGGELRSVHIHGPRAEIINLFHFPAPERALPIYALEFVIFGRRPVVGVIDAKPLCAHPYADAIWRQALGSAHEKFPALAYAEDPPAWYQECRSGLDFYTRPQNLGALGELRACHGHIWAELVRAETTAPLLPSSATPIHAQALAAYKDHHRRNSPGLPFLHRSFGPEWTGRFLTQALFS